MCSATWCDVVGHDVRELVVGSSLDVNSRREAESFGYVIFKNGAHLCLQLFRGRYGCNNECEMVLEDVYLKNLRWPFEPASDCFSRFAIARIFEHDAWRRRHESLARGGVQRLSTQFLLGVSCHVFIVPRICIRIYIYIYPYFCMGFIGSFGSRDVIACLGSRWCFFPLLWAQGL